MKQSGIYLLLLLGVLACGVKDTKEYRGVVAYSELLEATMRKKDRELDEITTSMMRIENNLALIRRKEKSIFRLGSQNDSTREERIQAVIYEIGGYLKDNQATITHLEGKLENALNKNKGLYNLIALQKKTVREKEKQIQQLMDTVSLLRTELQQTEASKQAEIEKRDKLLEKTASVIRAKDEVISSVYYRIGSQQELVDKEIARYEGGVLGVGKSLLLNKDLNKDLFTLADARRFFQLDIGLGRKPKILSTHPTNSYYFIQTEGRVFLRISKPESFWSNSRFLVIVNE